MLSSQGLKMLSPDIFASPLPAGRLKRISVLNIVRGGFLSCVFPGVRYLVYGKRFLLATIYARILLRGTILNRTYGTDRHLPGIYFGIFTINNNIWSYTMVPP